MYFLKDKQQGKTRTILNLCCFSELLRTVSLSFFPIYIRSRHNIEQAEYKIVKEKRIPTFICIESICLFHFYMALI